MDIPPLTQSELQLIQACEIANQDPDVQQLEQDFDGLNDRIAEPFIESACSD